MSRNNANTYCIFCLACSQRYQQHHEVLFPLAGCVRRNFLLHENPLNIHISISLGMNTILTSLHFQGIQLNSRLLPKTITSYSITIGKIFVKVQERFYSTLVITDDIVHVTISWFTIETSNLLMGVESTEKFPGKILSNTSDKVTISWFTIENYNLLMGIEGTEKFLFRIFIDKISIRRKVHYYQ